MSVRSNFGHKGPFGVELVALACLLQAWLITGAWTTLNVTVSRSLGGGDSFAFTSLKKGDAACNVMTQITCASYGGLVTSQQCDSKEFCCKTCRCKEDRPTYIVHQRRCIGSKAFSSTLGSGCHFYLADNDSSSASCTSPTLPALDTTVSGQRSYAICGPVDFITDDTNIVRCELVPHKSRYLGNGGKWISFQEDSARRRVVKHGFTVSKLELQWSGGLSPALHGVIMSLAVKCVRNRLIIQAGLVEIEMNSCITFKTAGTRTWPGPRMSTPNITTSAPPRNHTREAVVMTTQWNVNESVSSLPFPSTEPGTTGTEQRYNVMQVPGDLGFLLIVVAAVLGSLMVLVLASICIAIVMFRKKRQRATVSSRKKKNRSNPMYERGPDRKLMGHEDSGNMTLRHGPNFYQPLVANTRPTWPGEPIYQSLDAHARTSNNSLPDDNRVSLPYCDMSEDGYLVPVDGHTYPTPPLTGSEGNATDVTDLSNPSSTLESRPRDSSNYDEPEGIIHGAPELDIVQPVPGSAREESAVLLDSAGKLAPNSGEESDNESYYEDMEDITLKIEEGKPFYHVLEKPSKGTKKTKRKTNDNQGKSLQAGEREAEIPADRTINRESETLRMHCTCADEELTKL